MSAAVGVLAGDRRQTRAALAEAVGRQQASPSGLLAAARDGDAQAFTALVQAFQFSVYHFILRMVRRPTTAEDLSQEVFIRLWRHLGEIQSAEMLPGWLRRVAANAVIDHWRKEEARERRLRILREHPVARYVVRPSSRLESQESLGAVRASLEALPARLRSVLLLRTVEGLSYEEVGQTLGLSVHAVRSRLFRARQELHKILKHKKAADHLARMYQPARDPCVE
jgi:RNA polymerase sigma-70 factor (ECF subfamily)